MIRYFFSKLVGVSVLAFISTLEFSCRAHYQNIENEVRCSDYSIVCKDRHPVGKIFYKVDTLFYDPSHTEIIDLKKDLALKVDSLLKEYVLVHPSSTEKIKREFDNYFRQFFAYKVKGSNRIYIKVSYSKGKLDYQYKYWSTVDDGGDDFFYIKYDLIEEAVVVFIIN